MIGKKQEKPDEERIFWFSSENLYDNSPFNLTGHVPPETVMGNTLPI